MGEGAMRRITNKGATPTGQTHARWFINNVRRRRAREKLARKARRITRRNQ